MNTSNPNHTILFAIGNSGRRDDGLGWAFAQEMQGFSGQIEYRYQLQIEDAELLTHFNQIVFVDARKDDGGPAYRLTPCRPAIDLSFSTHGLPPEVLLGWCQSMYGHQPKAWLLTIKGQEWNLECGLTKAAQQNLSRALRESDFPGYPSDPDEPS